MNSDAAQPAVADGQARRSLRSLSRLPLNGSIVGRTTRRMFLTNSWTLVVGFVLPLVGCGGRQMRPRSPSAADFGCFRVDVEGKLAHPLPALVELRLEPSACAFARGGLVLLGSRDGQAGPRVHGHWSPVNADEVTATWGRTCSAWCWTFGIASQAMVARPKPSEM